MGHMSGEEGGELADWNGIGRVWRVSSLLSKGSGPSVSKVGRGQTLGSSGGHMRCGEPAGRRHRGGQAGLKAER